MDRLVTPSGFAGALFVAPVPSGKSEILRAVAILALRGQGVVLATPPFGEDVRDFIRALGSLGAEVAPASDRVAVMSAIDRERAGPVAIHVGAGGAPARFLLALAAATRSTVTLTGGARLSARPFSALTKALAALGARVRGGPGLPLTVEGPLHGGALRTDLASESSQFVSALLLAGPAMERPLDLELTGPIRSAPYLDLTVEVIRRAGARVGSDGTRFRVEPGFDRMAGPLSAPIDWSGAVPMLAASPLLGRPVFVPGLSLASSHPDARFAEIAAGIGIELREMDRGVVARGRLERGGEFDLGACPDLAPALAAIGAMTPGGIAVRNAPQLRGKESDRIEDLVAMLRAAEIPAASRGDGFVVPGCWAASPPESGVALPLDARGDHRLAMAGALIGMVRPVVLQGAEVVAKSFPGFFEVFPAGGRWRHRGDEPGAAWLP